MDMDIDTKTITVMEVLENGVCARGRETDLEHVRGRRLDGAQQRVGAVAGLLPRGRLAPEADAQRREPAVLAQHADALVACMQEVEESARCRYAIAAGTFACCTKHNIAGRSSNTHQQ